MATMKNKQVSFNVENEEEQKLLNYALSKNNFSGYVKELIKQDMKKKKPGIIVQPGEGINIKITD